MILFYRQKVTSNKELHLAVAILFLILMSNIMLSTSPTASAKSSSSLFQTPYEPIVFPLPNSDNSSNINEATENVITYNTSLADIPGEGSGNADLTVGGMLFACDETVSRGDAASIEVKPACDVLIRYIVNYCLSHMNDTMAMENKQICWDNAMDSGLKYAVKWLDGGTGVMLKAQSDIMATKASAIATLPKETPIARCEVNQGFKFGPAATALFMKMPLEKLRDLCS